MPFFNRPNANIYFEYDEQKNAPWIILLNGYSRSLSDFRLLRKRLASQHISVLTLDHRGSGQTENEGPFSLLDMAEDVLALKSELGIEKSHLLGISMGGIIAQIACGLSPSSILSLCLVSTLNRSQHYQNLRKDWPNEYEKIVAFLRPYFAPSFVEKNQLLIQAMAKNIEKNLKETSFREKAKGQQQALLAIDEFLPRRIDLKTLIIHGDEDLIISVNSVADLVQFLPHARVEILKDCGHLILAEKAESFFSLLSAFLKES